MESEFFGYKKGAFTGAAQDTQGLFQAANGGTLFLDEVADLPLAMQVKLLRAIQEKKVRVVGGTTEEAVDVRIISATHKNLNAMMEKGEFRQDLYYRLNVIQLKMPSLREHPEDIPELTNRLLRKLSASQGLNPPSISTDAQLFIQQLAFPGNVRELENMLERALALCDGERISIKDLSMDDMPLLTDRRTQRTEQHVDSTELQAQTSAIPPITEAAVKDQSLLLPDDLNLSDYLEDIEKRTILHALERTNNNKTAAAKLLGISFRTLRYRLSKLGLSKDQEGDIEEPDPEE